METPAQTVSRLLKAIEELTATEHNLLEAGALHDAHLIQERELPLVAKVAELMTQPNLLAQLAPEAITRARKIIHAQSAQLAQLSLNLVETRTRLDAISAAEKRAQLLAPAYRNSSGTFPPFGSLAAQV